MRILFTNIEMELRSGTLIVVRDFALTMQRRGHAVAVYSTQLGEPSNELAAEGIEVVDDLGALTAPPDVIHGHHNVPAFVAMATFPECPAIWFCHSLDEFDRAPRLGMIWRYVAVDLTRRQFLIECGAPPDRVEILHNAVDLARVPPRAAPLPATPKTALAFSKHSGHMPSLLAACRGLGIQFAALGKGAGEIVANPEQTMVRNDIVFATGRSAIEALCAGCAVIVADGRGLLGMVTTRNYRVMRNNNFGSGAAVLWREATHPALVSEIRRYDPADAAEVTARIRADADLEVAANRVEQLYREAVAAPRPGWSSADTREARGFIDNWPVNPLWLGLGEKERAKLAALVTRLAA